MRREVDMRVLTVLLAAGALLTLLLIRKGPEDAEFEIALAEAIESDGTEIRRLSLEYQSLIAGIGQAERSERIIVDTAGCRLWFRAKGETLLSAPCSAGSRRRLADPETGRKWLFQTPVGQFRILSKLKAPTWRQPDWAFVEMGEAPPENERERVRTGVLGDYALGFGDGYYIHGTLYSVLIGRNVTHGCIRLEDGPLEELYRRVPFGTPVLIF